MTFSLISHDFLMTSHEFLNWPWFVPFRPLFVVVVEDFSIRCLMTGFVILPNTVLIFWNGFAIRAVTKRKRAIFWFRKILTVSLFNRVIMLQVKVFPPRLYWIVLES